MDARRTKLYNTENQKNHTTNRHKMYPPEATVKLVKSVSDQNVFLTYVCTVNNIKPENFNAGHNKSNYFDGEMEEIDDEEPPIQVERSKALHELVESHRNDKASLNERNDTGSSAILTTCTSAEESCYSQNESIEERNPNILKLTKMKWLTEDQPGSPDSSSPNVTPTLSSTSTNCSRESDEDLPKTFSSDKYLSTILRLDREHNLFGLSNIAIVGSRPSRKIKNQDERPVFHQTAIVQVCCGMGCCRHMSKTDLPSSLKCPTCRPCCAEAAGCPTCAIPCPPSSCSAPASCGPPCPSGKCAADCGSCFGLKISVAKKPKFEPEPVEITPRSSCVLQKPFAARPCKHCPPCVPPSSCFPYLMPCFWPSRPGAPCNDPTRCFHNPPCRPPRRPRSTPGQEPSQVCPPKSTTSALPQCTACFEADLPNNLPDSGIGIAANPKPNKKNKDTKTTRPKSGDTRDNNS
ncbi:uncharacterized protein LOC106139745 [Amyelois transitella]|uniref:uncharacterized protein LOC106139745 n=1 Tax=Amyelois transitella TaxID=680683 RepID=UPI00067AC2A6|nr:uncharacterized protein LOC106139745 [Amyelois transitella]